MELGCSLCPSLHTEGVDSVRDGLFLAAPSRRSSRVVALPPAVLGAVAVLVSDAFVVASQLPSARSVLQIPNFVTSVLYAPGLIVIAFLFRRVARDHAQSISELERFSIQDATCTVEEDRVTVEDNVVSLMLHLKCVPSDCTREDALSAFNLLVRSSMPRTICASTGRTLLRFEYIISILFPLVLSVFDIACARLVVGDSTQQVISAIIEAGTRAWAVFPLCFALLMWLCSCVHSVPVSSSTWQVL